MNYLGQRLKQLREESNLLLRQVAAAIDTDTALVSKFEHGDRKPSKEQVQKLAVLFQTDQEELMKLWLADKVTYVLNNNEPNLAKQALDIVQKRMKDEKFPETD
ncbi:MAG: helix-turn-helix domain-containing protein [Bacteroidetes bacterium]|nr:helix-turn-helix domain-containing protein [Bacteroidota bacterium]